jgi:hydrogenase maturation protease
MSGCLLIAFGNPLRGDDGLAEEAARLLERELAGTQTQVLVVHQLVPELAETMSTADIVVFVDASAHGQPGSVHNEAVLPEEGPLPAFDHVFVPATLLAYCLRLYGQRPAARLFSISGESFAPGIGLSAAVRKSIPKLVEETLRWIHSAREAYVHA